MPVPKRRTTPSKRGMRRQQHDKVTAPNLVPCANCSAPTLSHRVCPTCGHYAGKAMLRVAGDEESTAGSSSASTPE